MIIETILVEIHLSINKIFSELITNESAFNYN